MKQPNVEAGGEKVKRRKKRAKYGNPCRSCKALFGHHHWFCVNPKRYEELRH